MIDSFECKKCGQMVKTGDMLEHIILVHNDSEAAVLLTALNRLSRRGT
jgi:hypothetical protein